MTTPGEALRDAVARHTASVAAVAAVAAEIERERTEASGPAVPPLEAEHLAAPVSPPGV